MRELKEKIILSIETSCDETAICVAKTNGNDFEILSNIVSSQIKVHAPFGGVVPSLAKREHQKNLIPVLKIALKEARLIPQRLSGSEPRLQASEKSKILNTILERDEILLKKIIPFLKKFPTPILRQGSGGQAKIDFIAITYGPGLAPALWPGINLARALSFYWNIPLIPVNHLEAHILANWLTPVSENPKPQTRNPKRLFPAVCSVISGGHTLIVLMKKIGQYKIIGETRDDAAGECFDKSARLLGLGYPGGPIISQLAATFNPSDSTFKFPRPMINSKDFDFSFSGLKTSVLYFVEELKKKKKNIKQLTPALCYEIQEAINETLVKKTVAAAKKYRAKSIILGGGVIANQALKDKFLQTIKKEIPKINFLAPERKFTTDNAAMIAITAHLDKKIKKINWQKLKADANLKF